MHVDDRDQLAAFLTRWTHRHPQWWLTYRTPDALVAELLEDAEFQLIRLAGWLRSPDGQEVRRIVRHVLPWPYDAQVDLLVEAIGAVGARRREQRVDALRNVAVAGVTLLVVVVLSNRN